RVLFRSWSDAQGSTTSWSYTMPLLSSGKSYIISARIINSSGNILATTTKSFTYDSVVPTVMLSSTITSPTKTSPIGVTATFSEAVTGFIIGDITVGNGTASNFIAVSSTVYTFNVTPTAQGAVTINIAAGISSDAALNNNTAATQFNITYDTTAPVISGVAVSDITETSSTITWTTDKASTSQVEYGTSTAYGSVSTMDSTMITRHSVVLTGLTAGMTYNYRVKSKDAANNEVITNDGTFTTASAAIKSDCGITKTGDMFLLIGVIGSIVVVRKVRRNTK
ncbi:MAG: Ig-like domain-containing protein, partial [Chloroflexi bacterium]|nr:Ig-like domain-containing protein [Chloroflexota bacterium]